LAAIPEKISLRRAASKVAEFTNRILRHEEHLLELVGDVNLAQLAQLDCVDLKGEVLYG
jgi:hypothetical protein